MSFPSIAPTLGVASQSLPQDVSTPGSASNPLAAVLAAIQAAHGSTMGHLGTLAATAAKASPSPKQPASGAPSQGNAAPGGQATPQSPMQGNMPPLSPPSMPPLSPPNQNGSLAQGSNPLPQPNFQQFGSAPQPGGSGPAPMSGQGGSGVPPELAGILANADNMAARSGSYFDQGRADLDEMNRQKMTAANMAPPQMQGPWNKQSLMGTALGLFLNGLMRGGNAGAAGMVQGATQGANQTAQIGNQNAMARFEQQRGVPLTAAEIAGQKAQTEFGRGGAMLNYSTEIQKAVAPAVARGAYLLKAAMINGRRSLAVANIRAAAGQYTDPQLRAGFMRGLMAADQQLNPDEPPLFSEEELKAAGALTPGQQDQIGGAAQKNSQAGLNDAKTETEKGLLQGRIEGLFAQNKLAEARAFLAKNDADLKAGMLKWMGPQALSKISYQGVLSEAAMKNADANMVRALNTPHKSGLEAADKMISDAKAKKVVADNYAASLQARILATPDDPNVATWKSELDKANASSAGNAALIDLRTKDRNTISGGIQDKIQPYIDRYNSLIGSTPPARQPAVRAAFARALAQYGLTPADLPRSN